MSKLIGILIFIGGIITAPFWVICLIIIVLNAPKDLCEKVDEYDKVRYEL